MFITCIRRAFIETLGSFSLFYVDIRKNKKLPGTIPDNNRGFDETLRSGVEVLALLTSWEVSVQ